jgi:hypothetical protein
VIAVLEGVLSVTATIVLVDLFRGVRAGTALIRPAYGAYLVQAPVLVALALALRAVPLPSAAKLLILLPAGVAACFGLAALLLRIPALRRVL